VKGKADKIFHLLDCTLRDGGYVNNWEFDNSTAMQILNGLYHAGVDIIECGIMGKCPTPGKTTKFNSFEEIEPLLQDRKNDCLYAVMLTYSEKDNFNIPDRSEKTVNCIRLAFFKNEWKKSIQYALYLKDKGYQVFLQAMATYMYSTDELLQLISAINHLMPESFYIVDSFGTLYNDDLLEIAGVVDKALHPDIMFGFHAHNNIQLAFSNTIAFFQMSTERKRLITDSSIYGMGRGAGNVTTELIMSYLNTRCNSEYRIEYVLELFDKYLRDIFKKYFWGYTLEYYLTSAKDINSAYGWYLTQKGVSSLLELNSILEKIPDEVKFTLTPRIADNALQLIRGERDNE
jgi:4-hydroxy 2-oxovalerate aldolase